MPQENPERYWSSHMRVNWKSSIVAAAALLSIAGLAQAIELNRIQQRYSHIEDFVALFSQDTFQVIANKTVHFTGKVSYKRIVGVRMDVFTPQRQLLVLKGQTVLIILPEEGTTQVQEIPKEIAAQNILGFFSGLDSIEDHYTVQKSSETLILKPKEGTGSITVWVDKDNLITRILLKDATGNASDIVLSDYRTNRGLSDDLFRVNSEENSDASKSRTKKPSAIVK
jgi:chaperone LolA